MFSSQENPHQPNGYAGMEDTVRNIYLKINRLSLGEHIKDLIDKSGIFDDNFLMRFVKVLDIVIY